MDGASNSEKAHAAELVSRLLHEEQEVELRIKGSSMSPFLRSGDVVVLAPLGGRSPGTGDVVAVRRSTGVLVHRVVGRRGASLLTLGDAVGRLDVPAAPEDVVGRAVAVRRGGRRRRLGLGPERYLIAWLSRCGILAALWRTRRRFLHLFSG